MYAPHLNLPCNGCCCVTQELNRSQKDCRSKWTTLQRSVVIQELKKGPFTPEEDALVMQRVAEWGDKGQVRVCCSRSNTDRVC